VLYYQHNAVIIIVLKGLRPVNSVEGKPPFMAAFVVGKLVRKIKHVCRILFVFLIYFSSLGYTI